MNIKQLIKAELDHLSTQELQEFYELLKSRSQDKKKVDHDSDWDKLSQILDECQIETGITDLAEQHDHYIHGTPKKENKGVLSKLKNIKIQAQEDFAEDKNALDEWDLIIQECQINTGITDLAEQHDHYIHGIPKR